MEEQANGAAFNCPEYAKCPVCFGCRNYNPSYVSCREMCGQKKDICDTSKHKPDLLGKFYKNKPVYSIR